MNNTINYEYQEIIELILSIFFAFFIGMSLYIKKKDNDAKFLYGSERTFVFIAVLGYILFKATPIIPFAFVVGFVVLAAFLLVFYWLKGKETHYGITSIILGLIIYVLPLMFNVLPLWLALFVLVVIMVLLETKAQVKQFAAKLYHDELLTLAKFVFISGVLLPIIPKNNIIEGISISFYNVWLAIVAISGVSYFSYILKKYVFPNAGLFITGVLGGLYSSTATTFILSRKSKEQAEPPTKYASAIFVAIVMMFIRIFILMYLFIPQLTGLILPQFAVLIAITGIIAFVLARIKVNEYKTGDVSITTNQNPLELKIALVFALLYVIFTLATHYTLEYYGDKGLSILSFIIGFTDIDPFLLSLFQGKYENISLATIGLLSLQAIISNNILKTIFSVTLGNKEMRKYIIIGFSILTVANILLLFTL